MNYKKIYNQIIENAGSKNRIKLNKNNIAYFYYENHHIIPKCLGGLDDKKNLVLLTAKEHFICHKLLTYIYRGNRKIALAFHKMAFSKKHNELVSARDYAYARELISIIGFSEETRKKLSNSLKGRPFSKKGLPLSDDHKKKISVSLSGKNNPMYGKKQTLESIEKNRLSNTGKKHSEESKRKMSISHKGSKRNEITKQNMRNSWIIRKINYPISDKTRKKMSEAAKKRKRNVLSQETIEKIRKGNLGFKQQKICCVYCGKICSPATVLRWHN